MSRPTCCWLSSTRAGEQAPHATACSVHLGVPLCTYKARNQNGRGSRPAALPCPRKPPTPALPRSRPARSAELKSLNLNPAKPHQLVVGASDPYVRVFDRRKLSTGGLAVVPRCCSLGLPQPAPTARVAHNGPHLCQAGSHTGGQPQRRSVRHVMSLTLLWPPVWLR